MDINEKIAQRRLELEAQNAINQRTENEIVQLAVERNLKSQGIQVSKPLGGPKNSTEEKTDLPGIESELLKEKISWETEEDLNMLAERFNIFDKMVALATIGLPLAFVINGMWLLGIVLLVGSCGYLGFRFTLLREEMKFEQAALRSAGLSQVMRDELVASPSEAVRRDEGLKYVKNQGDMNL